MSLPETRPSLLVRLGDGDNEAWAAFLAGYEPFLLQLLRSRGLQEADAQDVAQDILMSVSRAIPGWKPDGQPAAFRRWLVTVARNAAIKSLIKTARQPRSSGGSDPACPIATEGASETVARLEYQRAALLWAMDQIRSEFRPATWAAFWGTVVQGREVSEVGREWGLSLGAIYMARSRVMARLRSTVRDYDPERDHHS